MDRSQPNLKKEWICFIQDTIEKLGQSEHDHILKIIKTDKNFFKMAERASEYIVNLNWLSEENIQKVRQYIIFCKKVEETHLAELDRRTAIVDNTVNETDYDNDIESGVDTDIGGPQDLQLDCTKHKTKGFGNTTEEMIDYIYKIGKRIEKLFSNP